MFTHTTTFYSFKGGVGRTLLLANVGALLAKQGRRVLLWDLDLEAPGMHNIPRLEPAEEPERGFLEWLLEWQEGGKQLPLTEAQVKALAAAVKRVPGISNLSILPACGQHADFASLYQSIDWSSFMVKAPEVGLQLFRSALTALALSNEYEHVLIDSRTGLTDLGGILTAVLPDVTVLIGSYGHQNTRGLLHVKQALERAVAGKVSERGDQPDLKLALVASPVPEGEEEAVERRRNIWEELFRTKPTVEVPWDRRLLFEEALLGLDDEDSKTGRAYHQLAAHVTALRGEQLAEAEAVQRDRKITDLSRDPDERLHRDDPRLRRARGLRFEDRVRRLLELLGYTVEPEQEIAGNKVDLVAKKSGAFLDELYWVECKDHKKPVGKEVLEKLIAWTSGDAARRVRARGMVVAQRFSPQALSFAKDRDELVVVTAEALEKRLIDFGPYLARLRAAYEGSELSRTYVQQRVLLESLPDDPDGVDLLEHARAWALGNGRRLWLLLGDYGTGKSVFFRRFAYELAVRAEEDDSAPIPIAIDLKRYPNAISLEALLQEHLGSELGLHKDPAIVLHLLAAGRIVLLLDAFDEMGVAAAGRPVDEQFLRLASVAGEEPTEARGNRVLVTCRTHFFRDQQQVKDTAEGRIGDTKASKDSALGRLARRFDASIDEMLLFSNEQIAEYLTHHLGEARAEEALAFIERTYDLGRLAPRPVLLELIVKALPKLARDRDTVTAADLYRHYTDLWLEDRAGTTLLTSAAQRGAILRVLAFELWGLPQRRIHHRELLSVLRRWPQELFNHLDLERVDFELRTAAFLTRTPDGFYSFSHKSFLEFFYARHLLDQLDQGKLADGLAGEKIAPEVVRFLLELVGQETRTELAKAVRGILKGPYRAKASENALRIGMQAGSLPGSPDPSFFPSDGEHADLRGAQLDGERLHAAPLEGADLRGASLEGADLEAAWLKGSNCTDARLTRANLYDLNGDHALFDGAQLDFAVAHQASLTLATFDGASAIAADFSDALLTCASFRDANLHGARFARAMLSTVQWQGATTTCVTAVGASGGLPSAIRVPPKQPRAQLPWAGAGVLSVAFSPDGKRILTGFDDNTTQVWDAASGKALLTLTGHKNSVRSVAFSPDGKRILTGSLDNTAQVWDTASGKALLTLTGHKSSVRSVAFSPDGKRILTGSDDNTTQVWDAASGKALLTLTGHKNWVMSVAFSPDGKRILTGSLDGTVRLWDASSGEPLLIRRTTRKGWFAIDPQGRWRGEGDGPTALTYIDPDEVAPLRTVWLAEDFPDLRLE